MGEGEIRPCAEMTIDVRKVVDEKLLKSYNRERRTWMEIEKIPKQIP